MLSEFCSFITGETRKSLLIINARIINVYFALKNPVPLDELMLQWPYDISSLSALSQTDFSKSLENVQLVVAVKFIEAFLLIPLIYRKTCFVCLLFCSVTVSLKSLLNGN